MSFMFNHWFEDDIDCKRENEVHKPILNTNYVSEANGYEVQAVCRICKKGVSNCAFLQTQQKNKRLNRLINLKIHLTTALIVAHD